MFYKKNDEGNWFYGNEVHFPDGTIINNINKNSYDGWNWHDTAPEEYIIWQQSQNDEI